MYKEVEIQLNGKKYWCEMEAEIETDVSNHREKWLETKSFQAFDQDENEVEDSEILWKLQMATEAKIDEYDMEEE